MTSPLEALYPGLKGAAPVKASRAELLTSVRTKAADSVSTKTAFFASQADALVDMSRGLADAFRRGGRLFTMGNGGSASDAAHVAVEFNHPVTVGRPALPAAHLGADIQLITALGNDVGFDQIFARQVRSLGQAQDALLGLSTSGNSTNLLTAFEAAKRLGMTTMALVGGDGGRCRTSDAVDIASSSKAPAFTGSRSATSRRITSSGTSCTPCSRKIASPESTDEVRR